MIGETAITYMAAPATSAEMQCSPHDLKLMTIGLIDQLNTCCPVVLIWPGCSTLQHISLWPIDFSAFGLIRATLPQDLSSMLAVQRQSCFRIQGFLVSINNASFHCNVPQQTEAGQAWALLPRSDGAIPMHAVRTGSRCSRLLKN